MIDLSADARRFAQWLRESDKILIGAGAGLSAAAGVDYGDPDSFARLFPAMVKRGFRARYQLIGYRGLSPAAHWGYWARHVDDVRFSARPAAVYETLRQITRGKDTFVVTSNVDALFVRHGFDAERVFTPQGDYARMQCMVQRRPECTGLTWPSEPIVKRLVAAVDPDSEEVRDASLLPHCPHCGGEVFFNVRLTSRFVEAPYDPANDRLLAWLRSATRGRLLAVEIGAGFNTPGVIRWPLEAIVEDTHGARLVRVNPEFPEVPEAISGRGLSIRAGAAQAISAFAAAL